MPERCGRYTIKLPSCPSVLGYASVVGKTEGEGPLASEFDFCYPDDGLGQTSWEKAESFLHEDAVRRALTKAGLSTDNADMIFSGDLLNQCMSSCFGLRDMQIPFAGLFGACSTMALSLALASLFVDCQAAGYTVASTSSHFCSAEKQFRYPLEYGGQRPPTAQRTATAAGAVVMGKGAGTGVCVDAIAFGRIHDLGIKDANNMGAAMAPAAARTIVDFLNDTGTTPDTYDMILTGDLANVGSTLLVELLRTRDAIDISAVHNDCGKLLYDNKKQDVHSGGSGCGCSAAVLCADILRRLAAGTLKKVLFVGTGALMSPTSSQQGETIPAIAHAVSLCSQ